MANLDSPNGLRPTRYISGAPYNGAGNIYHVPATDATAIFIGDLVTLTGTSDTRGIPTVEQADAGDVVLGVCIGVRAVTQESTVFRAASTERYIFVEDSPEVVYEIQEDSVGGALTADSVGLNANFIVGTGSTSTGISAMELDSNTAATTATLPLKILRLVDREDNEIGDQAKWEVRLNSHRFRAGVIGV